MGQMPKKIETEIISEESDFLTLAPVWNQLLENSLADVVFLTFEWLSTWWHYFGARKELFIIAVREENRVVGLAPLMVARREGFRRLEFLGEKTVEYKDFIIAKDCDRAAVLEAIFNAIRRKKSWDLMRMECFAEDSPNCALLHALPGWLRELRPVWNERYDVSPYVQIDRSWEGYWASLKRGVRHDATRLMKQLNRDMGPVVFREPCDLKEVERYLDELIQQQIARRKDEKSEFSPLESPVVCDFYKDLAKQFFHKKWLDLPVLSVNGEVAAIHFGFVYGGKYYCYIHSFNHAFAKYGVGKLMLLHLLKEAFEGGLRELDLLVGNEPYKSAFNPKLRKLSSVEFFPKGVLGGFARIWFEGIRPKIEDLVNGPGHLRQVKFRLRRIRSERHRARVSPNRSQDLSRIEGTVFPTPKS